ncbi:MAG TPA: hypothetical protein VFV87_20490 [Pirellulaceae bacterium]|nr:hypothetical protein [Pirellulaceae bacterium]
MGKTFGEQVFSIVKGAGLAAGGAALAYFGSYAAGHPTDLLGLLAAGVASVGLNILRKFGGGVVAELLK